MAICNIRINSLCILQQEFTIDVYTRVLGTSSPRSRVWPGSVAFCGASCQLEPEVPAALGCRPGLGT